MASATERRWARQRGSVDGEGQAHRQPPTCAHVDRERLVERAVEREVPLAGVLDGLAAGADLELDQPGVGVVGVEGVGDAAQVVDVGAGGDRVADHRPLHGVGAADLALLGGGGAVGVPGVGADADRDRRGDQVALVAGEPEPDPVGALGAERVDHGAEVAERARGEVVALGGVDVEVVEGLEVALGARRVGGREVTSTPSLAAFLMLRRHSWFMPLRTSSSVRAVPSGWRSGTWKTWRGWPAANPPSTACGRQPSSVSWETTRAPVASRSVGARSSRRRTAGSAMPALIAAASQRRVTTGGPMRTPNAPWLLDVRGQRAQQRAEVVGRPVEQRALGQVGQEPLEPWAAGGRAPARRRPARRRRRTSRSTRGATRP